MLFAIPPHNEIHRAHRRPGGHASRDVPGSARRLTSVRRVARRVVAAFLALALALPLASPLPAAAWSSSANKWDTHDWVMFQGATLAARHGFTWFDLREAMRYTHDSVLADTTATVVCDPSDPTHIGIASNIDARFAEVVDAYKAGDYTRASRLLAHLAHIVTDLGDPFFAAGMSSSNERIAAYDFMVTDELSQTWWRSGWVDRGLPPYITQAEAWVLGLKTRSAARAPLAYTQASPIMRGVTPDRAAYINFAGFLGDTTTTVAGLIAAVQIAAQPHTIDVDRWEGTNRYTTAVAISQASKPRGSDTVILASGVRWPDALSASALAGALGAPILLTAPWMPADATIDEINRLGAGRVYIVGGTTVIDRNVTVQIRERTDARVTRIAGPDRYATSAAVAAKVAELTGQAPREVLVCTGGNFPDALAASQIAATHKIPVLLARPGNAAGQITGTVSALGSSKATVIGGPAAVSSSIEDALKTLLGASAVSRVYGADRYATASAILANAESRRIAPFEHLVLASGTAFPDAVSAGPAAAALGRGLALSDGRRLSSASKSAVEQRRSSLKRATLVGGLVALGVYLDYDLQRACDPAPVTPPIPTAYTPPATTRYYSHETNLWSARPQHYYIDRRSSVAAVAAWPRDANGILMVSYPDLAYIQSPVYNPTSIANYAIANHEVYLHEYSYSAYQEFIKHCEWLIANMDSRGRLRYQFDYLESGRNLRAPWWSAMAQGQAISALTRAYVETGNSRYLNAAEKAFLPMKEPLPEGVTSGTGSQLWLELYPENPPTQVLNGMMFAMWGVWDLYRVTGRADVKDVFDRSAATILPRLGEYEQDGIVMYERKKDRWVHAYHTLQVHQLLTISDITGVRGYADRADRWTLMPATPADKAAMGLSTPWDMPAPWELPGPDAGLVPDGADYTIEDLIGTGAELGW